MVMCHQPRHEWPFGDLDKRFRMMSRLGAVEPELNPEYTGRALSRTLTALSPESKEWALYMRVDRAYLLDRSPSDNKITGG